MFLLLFSCINLYSGGFQLKITHALFELEVRLKTNIYDNITLLINSNHHCIINNEYYNIILQKKTSRIVKK